MSSEQVQQWKHKLVAAFVSGASAGITAGVGVNMIDPDFSPTSWHGAIKTVGLMLFTAFVKGSMKAAGFLEGNPTPWDGGERRGNGGSNGAPPA